MTISIEHEDQRFWELTGGNSLITVFLDGKRKVYIKNYTLDYIFHKMGYEKYFSLCSISSLKSDNKPKNLTEEEEKDFFEKRTLKIAIFIREFIECENVQYDSRKEVFIISNGNEITELSSKDIDDIFDDFKDIYCLAGGKPLFEGAKPITEKGKDVLEKFRAATEKVNRKNNGVHTIDSIIMGITAKHQSYNFINIWNLTMWQLMKTHSAMYKNDNIYFTNIGIYTGNIDSTKMKMKQKELDWSIRD